MAKHFILLLLSFSLFSCASRKVAVNKTQIEKKIDSVAVEKKDSVSVKQNAISIKENIDEVEIVPIDSTQPIIIGDKKYYNAILRIKKTRRQVLDTSKVTVSKSYEKVVSVNKNIKAKVFDKKVEKKANYWVLLWLLLIPITWFVLRRFALK
jgi:hypothetical protein